MRGGGGELQRGGKAGQEGLAQGSIARSTLQQGVQAGRGGLCRILALDARWGVVQKHTPFGGPSSPAQALGGREDFCGGGEHLQCADLKGPGGWIYGRLRGAGGQSAASRRN